MSHEKDYGINCEAPEHVTACDGWAKSRDHFTPKCIGKLLGWSEDQLDSPENIQYLSLPCHKEKDKDTALRKGILRQQLEGRLNLTFKEHTDIFLGGEMNGRES